MKFDLIFDLCLHSCVAIMGHKGSQCPFLAHLPSRVSAWGQVVPNGAGGGGRNIAFLIFSYCAPPSQLGPALLSFPGLNPKFQDRGHFWVFLNESMWFRGEKVLWVRTKHLNKVIASEERRTGLKTLV